MAVERIRQQKTPGQFGSDATSLSQVDIGAASYSRPGIVDKTKAIKAEGIANIAQIAGNTASLAATHANEFYEGYQLADVEAAHEQNINDYIESKKNPQIAQEAALDASTLDNVSNSLWSKLGEGAGIEDIDAVEKHFQSKLSTMKKAVAQGVMSPDEFAQRSLAITREAVNRNPALHDEIINHTKKVLNLTGMNDLLEADKKGQESADKVYQKRVDMNMQILKENNIPAKYDRYGNYDLQHGETQAQAVQQEKFAADAIIRQGTLRTQQEKDQAADFMVKFGPQGANGIINNVNGFVSQLLANPENKGEQLTKIRQAYQMAKQAMTDKAGPLMHVGGVKDVIDYFNKAADANLAIYEKLTSREDQKQFADNAASIMRNEDYIRVSKIASPQAVNMLTSMMQQVGPRLIAENPEAYGKIMNTFGNIFSEVSNGLGTDYSVKDNTGKSAVSSVVAMLSKEAGKGNPDAKSVLDKTINTIYADSKTKFTSTEDKYKFYDDYIASLAHPDSKEGLRNINEGSRDKASQNFEEYMQLTMGGMQKDLAAISNKGTEIKLGRLPDGRLTINTSNQVDTDLLNQKYGIRINNGLKAFANLIGSETKAASDLMFQQYDVLKSVVPSDQGFGNRQDGSKKGSGFLGVLSRPDGNVSTELATGVNIGGKELDIPLLVPGLSKSEVDTLLSLPQGEAPPRSILDKAVSHAKKRMSEGKSVFADESESPKKEGDGRPNETNPLNLTIPGKTGKFQKFESTEDGIRAASTQLDRYFTGKTPGTGTGLNTLDQIGGKWNNENEAGSTSKKNYVASLAKNMGVDPHTPLDLNNPRVKADLIHAMSIAEGRPVRPSQIISALGI